MYIDLKQQLISLAEPKYRDFSASLIPNIDKSRILGVRLPKLRKLAASIIKQGSAAFLAADVGDTLEERLVRAFVIGGVKLPFDEQLKLVEDFLPYIDNWSVCDSFVSSLKSFSQNREAAWAFISEKFYSSEPYTVRFALVAALRYFADEEHADTAFEIFDSIKNDDYYVKTAVAWAVSEYFAAARDKTAAYLGADKLDQETHNKAIRKITESLRVSKADKQLVRTLKR